MGDGVTGAVDDDQRDRDDRRGRERRIVPDQCLTDRLGDEQQQDQIEDRDLREPALAAEPDDEQEAQIAPMARRTGSISTSRHG